MVAKPVEIVGKPDEGTVRVSVTPLPTHWVTQRAIIDAALEPASEDLIRWQDAANELPEVGGEFLGFRLICELGRGAFGRVYLAQQGDLGSRFVALKVAMDIVSESVTLAQLQHTNIVPIYSFHRSGAFQAVCMPYFGATTLAQVLQTLRGAHLPHSGRDLRSVLNSGLSMSAFGPASSGRSSPRSDELPPAVEGELPERFNASGWKRLDRLSYVEAILTLGVQLAEGLSHAHARGILHCDMKPANVLLTDDGQPMLLDFNLAEDTKLRGSMERAAVGGTLQYMAPEHMTAFQNRTGLLDARCDLYSLGVMLYELLTGRHPFPDAKGPLRERTAKLLADRQSVPPLRSLNAAVSPCVEAIVQMCLAPDPANRYQQAEHLREDLERQLNHQRLKYAGNPSLRENARKWMKRHPKLTSSGSIAALAAALLVAVAVGSWVTIERNRVYKARAVFADHRAAFRDAQLVFDDRNQSRADLQTTRENLFNLLARYDVPLDGLSGDWLNAPNVAQLSEPDRARCQTDIGETFYLLARAAQLEVHGTGKRDVTALEQWRQWSAAAERLAGDRLPRAILEQRAALAEAEGDAATAATLRQEAKTVALDSPRDLYLVGAALSQTGRQREALPFAIKATQKDPKNLSAWFVRGSVHLALEQNDQAAMSFGACLALKEDFAPALLNRALAFLRLEHFDQARADCDQAIALKLDDAEAYLLRARVKEALRDLPGVEADLTAAIATGHAPVRAYLLRSNVRGLLKNAVGAKADRDHGLSLKPADELSWIGRAEFRTESDPAAALADVDEALKLNPTSAGAMQLQAHLLGEALNRPLDAMAVLDRGVELHPDLVEIRAGRGVILARQGKRVQAHDDAKAAWRMDRRASNAYQIACIYALTSKTHPEDKAEANRLLWIAFKAGFGLDLVDNDPDLDALRNDNEYKRNLADARILHGSREHR